MTRILNKLPDNEKSQPPREKLYRVFIFMKIDKPYNCSECFRSSSFAFSPRMLKIKNGFFPGVLTDFLQYRNGHPIDKKPEVLV